MNDEREQVKRKGRERDRVSRGITSKEERERANNE